MPLTVEIFVDVQLGSSQSQQSQQSAKNGQFSKSQSVLESSKSHLFEFDIKEK